MQWLSNKNQMVENIFIQKKIEEKEEKDDVRSLRIKLVSLGIKDLISRIDNYNYNSKDFGIPEQVGKTHPILFTINMHMCIPNSNMKIKTIFFKHRSQPTKTKLNELRLK